MRGYIRIVCAAAGIIACALGAALAAGAIGHQPAVPLRLSPSADSAATYLSGTHFVVSSGSPDFGVAASGIIESNLRLPQAYGPPVAEFDNLRDFAATVSLSPELALDLGYGLDDAGRFVRYNFDGPAFNGLFLSTTVLGSAQAPFAARATYVGAAWLLTDNLRIALGAASYTPVARTDGFDAFSGLGRPIGALLNYGAESANSLMAGVSWNFAKWGGLDFNATHTGARAGLIPDSLDTTSIDVSAHLKFGGGWVTTASYGEALTKLDLKPSAINAPSQDELHRTGYGLSVAKHGVFGDDAIGLSLSQPATPGNSFETALNGAPSQVYIGRDHLLDDLKPETDIEVGYVTTFLDGSLALQTNAAYQMNFAGQSGTNSLSLLSRAKIKF